MLELLNYNISDGDGDYIPELTGFAGKYNFPSSLGDFTSTGVIDNDQFTSVLDGSPVVRTYDSFTINAGHIVTTTQRCKGLYLNILGNLVVNGTLSMTARGAKTVGQFVAIDFKSPLVYYFATSAEITSQKDYQADPTRFSIINKAGGLGVVNNIGGIGINGACGAGGGTAYRGGHATSFSGGAGAGGNAQTNNAGVRQNNACQTPADDGGAGGTGYNYWLGNGGGGAGNPGGLTGGKSYTTNAGTGGLLILFVKGDIILGTGGQIVSKGVNGAAGMVGSNAAYTHYGQAGAGSGGGAIHVFYKKGITGNTANIAAPGGTGSYAGGKGTVNLVQL